MGKLRWVVKFVWGRYFSLMLLFLSSENSLAQTVSLKDIELDLVQTYSKIFPFYYDDKDSAEYYSNLFSEKMNSCIKNNPSSHQYSFQMLKDSCEFSIVISTDGLFKIYSWDTWLGGTMHIYKNLYQYKANNNVYVTDLGYSEDDIGAYTIKLFTLHNNSQTYYLAISSGSESSKDKYEFVKIYSINGNTLNDTVHLIKTKSQMANDISFEYDFTSVNDVDERPLCLTKYDEAKKIIYIPIVTENGTVTKRYIEYQLNGNYFERIAGSQPRIKTK